MTQQQPRPGEAFGGGYSRRLLSRRDDGWINCAAARAAQTVEEWRLIEALVEAEFSTMREETHADRMRVCRRILSKASTHARTWEARFHRLRDVQARRARGER